MSKGRETKKLYDTSKSVRAKNFVSTLKNAEKQNYEAVPKEVIPLVTHFMPVVSFYTL